MTVVMDADVALQAPMILQQSEGPGPAETIEDIIAAHRAALVELAPHQAWRSVREETAWHITELGLLLRVRGAVHAASEQQNPAPSGVHLPERGQTRENTSTDHLRH